VLEAIGEAMLLRSQAESTGEQDDDGDESHLLISRLTQHLRAGLNNGASFDSSASRSHLEDRL
jgi:hypothetical protein